MAERPINFTIHPEEAAPGPSHGDLLSHVLAQVRLSGDGIISITVARGEAVELLPDAGHVCLITEGAVLLEDDGKILVVAAAGDLLLLSHGVADLGLVALEASATVVVGRFRFDPDSARNMVLALPPYIHIEASEGAGWLDGVLHFMMIEASDVQPGAALMISRLIDLAVIRTLRTWIQRGQTTGWLGGLSDARIARTLRSIHETPARLLSIEALAGIAGMSRSSFCDRFTALVGRSPLRYQNELRLTLARELLSRRTAGVGEIGLSIGYESEAAFSRAYKALFGHSPRGEYSRLNAGLTPTSTTRGRPG